MTGSSEFGVRSSEWKQESRKRATLNFALSTLNSHGFTLLEVMVAVAIMSTVLVTLIGLSNRSTQDVKLAEHMVTATLLAKRVMTETTMVKLRLPVEEEGTFPEEDFSDYAWKKLVAPTPFVQVMEVRIAVLWKEGSRPEQVELVSYE